MPRTYSSNNEEALIKSMGPIRILDSGTSFAGSVLPQKEETSSTIIHGKKHLYRSRLIFKKKRVNE